MRVIRGYRELGLDLRAPAVTIGNFDGVHRGHQQVMRSALDEARRRGVVAVACTFDPHTVRVLRPAASPRLLQTLDQRLRAIGELGIDVAVVIPFDLEVARTPHEEFVDGFLVGQLHVGSLHLSKGFSFGKDKAGNREYLERRSAACGFHVVRVPALVAGGAPISATRIRALLARGAVAEAHELLDRPFALAGRVVQGAGRGDLLAARTANLAVANEVLPARGVYATEARLGARRYPAATNVGVRPTFGEDGPVTVEAHLLDYGGGPLYGEAIELCFLERLRDERQFPSPHELRRQIAADVRAVRGVVAAAEPRT